MNQIPPKQQSRSSTIQRQKYMTIITGGTSRPSETQLSKGQSQVICVIYPRRGRQGKLWSCSLAFKETPTRRESPAAANILQYPAHSSFRKEPDFSIYRYSPPRKSNSIISPLKDPPDPSRYLNIQGSTKACCLHGIWSDEWMRGKALSTHWHGNKYSTLTFDI